MGNIILQTGQVKDFKTALLSAVSTLTQEQAVAFGTALAELLPIATKQTAESGDGEGIMNAQRVLEAIQANAASQVQGDKADTAVQPETLGTAAYSNNQDFATAAQGVKADNAVQLGGIAPVAISGSYGDLISKPVLGNISSRDIGEFATAAQGIKADQAVPLSSIAKPNGIVPLDENIKIDSKYLPTDGSFKGTWNAATNTPTITSSSGINNNFYIVSTAGSTNIDGSSTWTVGDQIRFNGTVWQRIPSVQAVSSVAGKTGAITLNFGDITGLGSAAVANATSFATAAQGVKADSALPSSSYTAASILAKLLTVDGAGSNLDSDFLGGQPAEFYTNFANFSGAINTTSLPSEMVISGKYTGFGLRLTSGSGISGGSTEHAFQIGLSTSLNLIMDSDDIQARQNGGASTININRLGGSVVLGSTTSSVKARGAEIATFYEGSTVSNTDYPVGSIELAFSTGTTTAAPVVISKNALVYLVPGVGGTSGPGILTASATTTGQPTQLIGTWRSRGMIPGLKSAEGHYIAIYLVQRTN